MKITKNPSGTTFHLWPFSGVPYIDIQSMYIDKTGEHILFKVHNWHAHINYSIANTRVKHDDFDKSWEITLDPYRDLEKKVISGLTFDEIMQMLKDCAYDVFFDKPHLVQDFEDHLASYE